MFNFRTFDKGPFITVTIPQERNCDWTDLKFSPDGHSLLIPTNGALIHLINANNGALVQTFTDQFNDTGFPTEASFSPDSQYILCGTTGGRIQVWNILTGKRVCVLQNIDDLEGLVSCVKFNPKYMMVASACTNMVFWVPAMDGGINTA